MASAGNSSDYDYIFKLVLIGDADVGKTNLLLRFTRNEFRLQTKTTIGVEFAYRPLTIEGKRIQNQIWDTAGEERFRSIVPQLYRGSEGVLVIFDLSNPQSLNSVTKWVDEVYQHTKPDLPIILIGNKSDLVDEQTTLRKQATALAKQLNISYMETSALNATNVEKAFTTLVTNIYRKQKSKVIEVMLPTQTYHEPVETIPIKPEPSIKLKPLPPTENENEQSDPKKRRCCETS